ncbi:MAG: HAD family hydrolase [Gammaproteobacteria bacterium]
MKAALQTTPSYEATPETVLDELRKLRDMVLVDLDETLYLRNSTEDFIDLALPGLLALLVLRVLDLLKPWRWTGGPTTRDTWRVLCIRTLFPWTRIRWRHRVARLAEEFGNRPLIGALKATQGKVVIVTAGFAPIVTPLVAALGFPQAPIVAARVGVFADRSKGKLHAAESALGRDVVASSACVTDSWDDLPLLEKCSQPFRTVWPDAKFRPALTRVYLPGEYLSKVKRPGERYFARVIVPEDLALWVASSIELAAYPLLHFLGMCFLTLSFWAIYERGYVDNDWAAAHLERNGKLSKNFWDAPVATPSVHPWIWALLSGAAAVYLLRGPNLQIQAFAIYTGGWMLLLAALYASFRAYNRVDKSTRTWLFAVLQLARSAGFVVVVPVRAVAAIGLGANVLARWVPYYVYRIAPGKWPDIPVKLIRLVFFVVLAALLGVAEGFSSLVSWTTLLIVGWMVYRARGDIRAALKQIRRADAA